MIYKNKKYLNSNYEPNSQLKLNLKYSSLELNKIKRKKLH